MSRKYVFITGGVLSGLGKGVTAASTALLLQSMGYGVTAIKIDPYVNVDAGTMNPYMHGEVFVTEDGGETDLDLGHYERFLNKDLSKRNNITTGKVYFNVIERERRGDYLGQTVQIIPHITNEIKEEIRGIAEEQGSDIAVIEIGGTVGDIEGLPFLEAIRQMRLEEGSDNTLFIHVVLVPRLSVTGEQKTKPAQHSIQELRRIGIQQDIIVARSEKPLNSEARRKLALYGNIPEEAVFSNYDVEVVYEVPLILMKQGFLKVIAKKLRLRYRDPEMHTWIDFINKLKFSRETVNIAMVGKYTRLRDSYLSIVESVKHASAFHNVKPLFKWIEATDVERDRVDVMKVLEGVNGAIILPGFGQRGVEGKLRVIKVLREQGLPVLGICFGLQLMVVEFARNVLGLEGANSTEIDPRTPHPVVDLLEMQKGVVRKGGTMRLGSRPIRIVKGTLAHRIYRSLMVYERHRHRYQVNPKYLNLLEREDFIASGYGEEGFPEIMEVKGMEFYIGIQAHPEFKSRPLRPSPMFLSFIRYVKEFKS